MRTLEIGLLQPFRPAVCPAADEAENVLQRRSDHGLFGPVGSGETQAGEDAGAQLRHVDEVIEMAGLQGPHPGGCR
jgi:hypothetical protein